MTGNGVVTDLAGQVMGGGCLGYLAAGGESGQRNPRVLVHWPSTSGEVGVPVQSEFGAPGWLGIDFQGLGNQNRIWEHRLLEFQVRKWPGADC